MSNIVLKEESYKIVGICMEVHRQLGRGFLEIVYKDALEYEFKKQGIILPHKFYADFVVMGNVILEVKCGSGIVNEFLAQTINYLAVSECQLGLIVNFGKDSLEYKRVVL